MYSKDGTNYQQGNEQGAQIPINMATLHQGGYFPIQGVPREYLNYELAAQQQQQQQLLQGQQDGVLDPNGMSGHPMLVTSQPFDRCPVVCSVLTMLCCPFTLCCSVAALVYSMCSYVDYKINDANSFKRKTHLARTLLIVACLMGLLILVCSGLLIYLYHRELMEALSTFTNYVQKQKGR